MVTTDDPQDPRPQFQVEGRDGTPLAVWTEGAGPALVLVHGSIADHTTFDPFVAVLRDGLTTYSMDRRGFGASGDTAPYAIERDFEDVAASAGVSVPPGRRIWSTLRGSCQGSLPRGA